MKWTFEDIKLVCKLLICDKVKELFGIKTYTKGQEKMFNKTQIGSRVVCDMPISPFELVKIPNGHRRRPYIIVDKDEKYLYGYFCTTHPRKNVQRHQKQYIETLAYDRERKSYVIVTRLYKIEKKHIVSIHQKLPNELLAKINRCIYMSIGRTKYKGYKLFGVQTNYEIGDIFKENGSYYYVYQIYGKEVYAHPVYMQAQDNAEKIKINSGFKYIDFSKHCKFMDLDLNKLYSFYDANELKLINECKNKPKKKDSHVPVKSAKYNLEMPCGTVLKTPWETEEFMYLFSWDNKSYLTSLDSCEEGEFIIIKKTLDYLEKDGELEDESVVEIVEELVNRYKPFESILSDLLKQYS